MNRTINLIIESLPLLMQGAAMTIKLWLCASIVSIIVGMILGICTSRRLRTPLVATFIAGITFVARAVPFYVQLLIAYFVIPDMIGINLSPSAAGILALGFCSSGYMCEIVRA